MTKYHVNETTNRPNICRDENCKVSPHYDSREKAQAAVKKNPIVKEKVAVTKVKESAPDVQAIKEELSIIDELIKDPAPPIEEKPEPEKVANENLKKTQPSILGKIKRRFSAIGDAAFGSLSEEGEGFDPTDIPRKATEFTAATAKNVKRDITNLVDRIKKN